MSFLIVGTNGNFSNQFQNIAKNHISHSINRNVYVNWDKKGSKLNKEIIQAKSAHNLRYIVNTVGVISKNHTNEFIMYWNYCFPKYLYQISKELDLVLVTLGSIHENIPEMCVGNSYLESKIKLQQYLLKESFENFCHFQFHTWYGGHKVQPEMFLGQIITSIKNKKEFKMSDGQQLREYHDITDDATCVLNFLNQGRVGINSISHGERYSLRYIATCIFKYFQCEHLLKINQIAAPASELREHVYFPLGITEYEFKPTMKGIIDYVEKNI